jgi:drug/metabolite transporter (DMT)-like permease
MTNAQMPGGPAPGPRAGRTGPWWGAGSPLHVDAVVLAMTAIWAANMVVLKHLLDYFPPTALCAIRFLIVCVLALAVVAARGGPWGMARGDLPRAVLSGVIGVALYPILFAEGLARTTAFVSNLLQGTEPVFALLLLRLTRGVRVQGRQWLGVGLAMVGSAVFFLPRGGESGLSGFSSGAFLTLLAAAAWALYSLWSARLFARYRGRTVMFLTMWAGTVPLVLWALPSLATVEWARVPPLVWITLVISSMVPLYLGFWVWNWAVNRRGLDHVSLYLYVETLLTGVFAWLTLGERFGPPQVGGALVMLAGVHLARRPPGARGNEAPKEPRLDTSGSPVF